MDILNIAKSKTREKILMLFFLDVEKKYYLRELERILGVSVANIRRELLSLEKAGLFKREKQGKEVYYSLNKKSAIFEDVKNIVSKTIGVESLLKKELCKLKGIKKAFVFGSFAKQKENSLSDIDLMIIGSVDEDLLVKKISKLERTLKREVNYHLFDTKEWKEKVKDSSFLKSVVNDFKINIL